MAKPKDNTVGEEQARSVLQRLGEEIRRAGPGAASSLDLSFGKQPGWMRWKRYRGRIALHTLLDALNRLDIDPARFLAGAFREPQAQPDCELARLGLGAPRRDKAPRIVHRAHRRLEVDGLAIPSRESEGRAEDDGRSLVEELDALRYENPRRAVLRAEKAVDTIELALLPRLLGVAASAYRRWNVRLDEAEHCLHAGIGIAQEQGEQGAVADLLQRLAYVIADRGEHAQALALAERATLIYQDLGHRVGVGRTAVDRSCFLFYLDRLPEAISAAKAALRDLPETEPRNRFAALQYLGEFCRKAGEPRDALEYLGQATELVSELGPAGAAAEGHLLWLRASLLLDVGEHRQAARDLEQAIRIFRSRGVALDAALATTDLVRVQLRGHLTEAAWRTARTMLALIDELESNRLASAAVADLLRGEEALSLALVERVQTQLKKARAAAASAPSERSGRR